MTRSFITSTIAAGAFAAALVTPAAAAPFGPAGLGLGTATSAPVEQVRCNGCWVAGGVAAGVLAGAAIANAARGPYYAEPYYAAPPVVYAPPPPVVYAPAPRPYAYGKCWVQTGPYAGQGYYGRC